MSKRVSSGTTLPGVGQWDASSGIRCWCPAGSAHASPPPRRRSRRRAACTANPSRYSVDDIRLATSRCSRRHHKITLLDQHGQHRILLGLGEASPRPAGQPRRSRILTCSYSGNRRPANRIHGGQCIRTPGGGANTPSHCSTINGATENVPGIGRSGTTPRSPTTTPPAREASMARTPSMMSES